MRLCFVVLCRDKHCDKVLKKSLRSRDDAVVRALALLPMPMWPGFDSGLVLALLLGFFFAYSFFSLPSQKARLQILIRPGQRTCTKNQLLRLMWLPL